MRTKMRGSWHMQLIEYLQVADFQATKHRGVLT